MSAKVKHIGLGTVGNAKCGDIMKVDLKIENNVILDAKFKTFDAVVRLQHRAWRPK